MNKTKEKSMQKIYVGIILLAISVLAAFVLNLPTAGTKGRDLTFIAPYNEEDVLLKGTLWNNPTASYGVLLCPGYSCDRQKWRPMADLCAANGLTVMSFDYSGQGASMGTIGFDNAKTDRIPEQIDRALEVMIEQTGLDRDHIILMGHSMGGRSILRLLYDYNAPEAETRVRGSGISNVILLSPEVNYEFNAQASLFAGTSDDAEEPWHSYNESYIQGTNVWLFGSTEDDIVSDEDILGIFSHLGGKDAPLAGTWQAQQVNDSGSKLTVNIGSGVLHSYMMYSPKYAAMVNDALTEITGVESTYPPGRFRLIYLCWFTALPGLGLLLSALQERASLKNVSERESNDIVGLKGHGGQDAADGMVIGVPVLTDPRRFLLRKAVLWIPGIAAALLICTFCVVMPFGSPVMNIPYMCFIAGYGFVMLFAYRKGTFPGAEGKLPGLHFRLSGEKKQMWICAGISVVLCFLVWYVLRATMYRLIPLNARLFWVCFAAVMMTVGYYVSGCETDMLKNAGASVRVRFLYNLIQYVPLILLVVFYLVLKSYSGMIGQIQNMLLMYIFCVPLGGYIRKVTGNRLIGGLVTGFCFQTLMITSAALIAMF